jgi:hypothetical protein
MNEQELKSLAAGIAHGQLIVAVFTKSRLLDVIKLIKEGKHTSTIEQELVGITQWLHDNYIEPNNKSDVAFGKGTGNAGP